MPNDEYRRIGERIRTARLAAGLTQRELGAQIGVTDSAVTLWEKGRNSIGIVELKQIARILHRPLDYFTDGADVSQLPSERLRMEMHEQVEILGRDGQIPPPLVDWILSVIDEVLEKIESEEEKKRPSNH